MPKRPVKPAKSARVTRTKKTTRHAAAAKGPRAAAFDISKLDHAVRASPTRLLDWLTVHLPELVGPRVESLEPARGQRGTLLAIRGQNFATKPSDNHVTIGGRRAPVLAATSSELRVLVAEDIDSGPVKVKVAAHVVTAPGAFTIEGYPGADDDGPPVYAAGAGSGGAGDVDPVGIVKVLIVVCQARDLVPSSLATVRAVLADRWDDVQTFYNQASYLRTKLRYDIVSTAAKLDGDFDEFVDLVDAQNVRNSQTKRIAALAARHARNKGFDINDYQMLCCVVFTDGAFIRALGGSTIQTFFYDDGKPTSDPDHIHIDFSLDEGINLLWINENADWGRYAHEFGHNLVFAPDSSGTNAATATLGEDVYGSDLVDPDAATAQEFDLMGHHDSHPIFSGFHLEALGYYKPQNIKVLEWDRNPHSSEVEVVAHGLTEDSHSNRWHIVKVKVSDALSYYIEVRQMPGSTAQIFDDSIPVAAAPHGGGVIVTRVISGKMENNQQTRFITLMHDERVMIQGDTIEDPARALKITVVDDSVRSRPLVCRVRVEWAQSIEDDKNGKFDLRVTPWDKDFQTPDIWVDRAPFGSFDHGLDSQGRPKGNGDKPRVKHVNQFTARVHVSGDIGASDVKVTFYAITPPGVGDNGNWAPIAVKTIADIPRNGFADSFCNWVPVVGQHTCLKVFASPQLGEISGHNNDAQENVFDFQAVGSSPAAPLFIKTAVRNPRDERLPVSLSLIGLPAGWVAHLPHAWVWLDGKGERQIEIMVWPTEDIDIYRMGDEKRGRLPGLAPIRVTGYLERRYYEVQTGSKTVPGSRFSPIGGTLYRVGARKRANIRLERIRKASKDGVLAMGFVTPARGKQRVLVDVLHPDGKRRSFAQTQTTAGGKFSVVVNLLQDGVASEPGLYLMQAVIFDASELADAASNVVHVQR